MGKLPYTIISYQWGLNRDYSNPLQKLTKKGHVTKIRFHIIGIPWRCKSLDMCRFFSGKRKWMHKSHTRMGTCVKARHYKSKTEMKIICKKTCACHHGFDVSRIKQA